MPEIPGGFVSRELYGGALHIALPPAFVDVSDIRQIPDNQEVFINQANDQSVIVDLLEYQDHVQGEDSIKFHFQELASCNNALDKSLITSITPLSPAQMPNIDPSIEKWLLVGQQSIAKFKEEDKTGDFARNAVVIYMVLLRLPAFGTDILVTFNDPQFISQHSSSIPTSPEVAQEYVQHTFTPSNFLQSLLTFSIIDTSLFVTA